jgi:S1-C subfamily serine protease
MKQALWILCFVLASSIVSAADKISSTKVGENSISGITSVKTGKDGRIIILYSGGGLTVSREKLEPGFLDSWGITQEKIEKAMAEGLVQAEADLERAISLGLFREVDGVVYDLRKPQPDWTRFVKCKLIQTTENGALVDPAPDYPSKAVIFGLNLPGGVGDTDTFPLTAKLTGSFSYINKLYDNRTVRSYDLGIACKKDEIPEEILKGGKANAKAISGRPSAKKVLSKLPSSGALSSSGTGFFITEDGYLLTNFHVVEDARQVKIRTATGTLEARIVAKSKGQDLALLKIEGKFKALPLAQKTPGLGVPVFTIGFPNIVMQGLEPKYTDGKISSLFGMQDDPNNYQISVPVQSGNSGGPLLDSAGNVVGVIVARLSDVAVLRASGNLPQNVNYAIKLEIVREFLSGSPEAKILKAEFGLKTEEAVEKAKDAVAMVLCYE